MGLSLLVKIKKVMVGEGVTSKVAQGQPPPPGGDLHLRGSGGGDSRQRGHTVCRGLELGRSLCGGREEVWCRRWSGQVTSEREVLRVGRLRRASRGRGSGFDSGREWKPLAGGRLPFGGVCVPDR